MGCLLVFVLFLSANAFLILLFGREVSGRVESVGYDRHGINLNYSYRVSGHTFTGSERISAREAQTLPANKKLRVRTFAPFAAMGADVVGYGPPFWGTMIGLGILALPVFLIAFIWLRGLIPGSFLNDFMGAIANLGAQRAQDLQDSAEEDASS